MERASNFKDRSIPPQVAVVFVTRAFPILAGSSVSIEHRDYVVGLAELNAPVRILELSRPTLQQATLDVDPADERIIRAICTARNAGITDVVCVVNGYDFIAIPGGQLKRQVEPYLGSMFPDAKRVRWVARAVTETTRVPRMFAEGLGAYNEIWVPGEFHIETFVSCGVAKDKLKKIPEAVDLAAWVHSRISLPFEIPNRRKFAFLAASRYAVDAVGRVPTWNQARKAIPLLLRAFSEEFGPDEDVCLLIKGLGSAREEQQRIAAWLNAYGHPDSAPQIVPLGGPIPNRDLIALMAQADAFVGVSRGEGWGRPLAEAMLLGKPTIATRFGGNTEFMNDGNSYLVECSLAAVAGILPKFAEYGSWAEPSLSSLRRTLRAVVLNEARNKQLKLHCSRQISALYNRKAVAKKILLRIKDLLGLPEAFGTNDHDLVI